MARWTKNHMLEMGAALLAVGLVLTVVASIDRFSDTVPGWLTWYDEMMKVQTDTGVDDYNLLVLIAGPILLIWGGFWMGEQIILRRRFERMLDTPKRSEFSSRRTELEELTKRLPDGYKKRIKEKESEFVTKRST